MTALHYVYLFSGTVCALNAACIAHYSGGLCPVRQTNGLLVTIVAALIMIVSGGLLLAGLV